MSNFVVTNTNDTRDAVNYLLTTKAPGVLIVDGRQKVDNYTVVVNNPVDFTFYVLGSFDPNNPGLTIQIVTQQPNQSVYVFGQSQIWYNWSNATPNVDSFDFTVAVFRLNPDNTSEQLIDFNYGPYVVPTATGSLVYDATWIGVYDVPGPPGTYTYTIQTYYDTTPYQPQNLIMDSIAYQNATNLVTSTKS